jgi:hypothetical protein
MSVHMWPAIPAALPRVTPVKRRRLPRWLGTAVTTIAAALAVLLAAIAGVLLGIT